MMEFTRRDFVKFLPTLAALAFVPKLVWSAQLNVPVIPGHSGHNFKYIYDNEELRRKFHLFLRNVYSIYPDPAAHALIYQTTAAGLSDEDIYNELQKKFPDIKPLLSAFTLSIPALKKQKKEMKDQTASLVKNMKSADGYMEIGTTGRYMGGIREIVNLSGSTYILNTDGPSYNPGDIVDRGGIRKPGTFINIGDYGPVSEEIVKPKSVDLISNYIGFHHAPPEKRDAFIASIAKSIRPGGMLILRDHDVDADDMRFIVALAHDVFNAGLDVSWEKNLDEIRNFTSLSEIADKVAEYGLKPQEGRVLQNGDPTKNTLMSFVKA